MNLFKADVTINKGEIFKKLHFNEGSEAFKSAESIFEELSLLIRNNMRLTAVYKMDDSISFEKIEQFEKYVICFVSSEDRISEMSNEMMSEGEYIKGYLLHEIAADVIFRAADELNNAVGKEAADMGYRLSGPYAPGDGTIDLVLQGELLDKLKKETEINAYVNAENIIVPVRSLLYVFGLSEGIDISDKLSSCGQCGNINCEYRKK